MSCEGSLFGPSAQYIKLYGGDFISVEGSNTRDRLITSDLRMPYKQILKSRVILKAGQVNYLLNHLGLGDNATFLAMKALYDPKSVIEEDNYVNWSFYTDPNKIYTMAQLLVLTGNSTNRIQQLYLSNPNANYPVYIDVMIAVIDDDYSFFQDATNQAGLSFTGLRYTDILTYVVNESIVIMSNNTIPSPIAYLVIDNINSFERVGKIIIIDDSGVGTIFLEFNTENDALQALSLINWVTSGVGRIIQDLDPVADLVPPVVYFTPIVGLTGSTFSLPFDTSQGVTFSASFALTAYGGTSSEIIVHGTESSTLVSILIDNVTDNRDGLILLSTSNVTVKDYTSATVSLVNATGTYSMKFSISDIAGNYISPLENVVIIVT